MPLFYKNPSLKVKEYIQRCDGYEGFFTKENVAALTEAAGEDAVIKRLEKILPHLTSEKICVK